MLKSIVRHNTPDDDFEAQAEPILRGFFSDDMSDLSHVYWIEEDGAVIAVLTVEDGELIRCLQVAPDHRRQGHARSLLQTVMTPGAELTVMIPVMGSDEWVYEWMDRLGFEEHDSLPDDIFMHVVVPDGRVKICARHNTPDFAHTASALVRDLYMDAFGPEHPVTPEFIEEQRITKVFCIEQDGAVVAATMLKRFNRGYYIQGIAAQPQGQGHGRMLMKALIDSVPRAATIQLGVDTGKESTGWLEAWYERLGFHAVDYEETQIIMIRG